MDVVVDEAAVGTSNEEQSSSCTEYAEDSGHGWCERCEAYHVCPVAPGRALVGGASVHELP